MSITKLSEVQVINNGSEWNGVVPTEEVREMIMKEYFNEYPLAYLDDCFVDKHTHLLSPLEVGYAPCCGCWSCCARMKSSIKKKLRIVPKLKKN